MPGISAESLAKRAAGYLMAFGMPQAGKPDRRPSSLGNVWQAGDIELYRLAVLWMVMREHIPDTGQKIENVFVGKSLMVTFIGDKNQIIKDTEHELMGRPFSGEQFSMTAAVLDDHRLNPDDAVTIRWGDLCTMAGEESVSDDDEGCEGLADELIYVPRIPLNAEEAKAMLKTVTVFMDTTKPRQGVRDYAGYTNAELMRGKPAVRIR